MVECSPGTPFFQLSLSREGMGYAPWAVEQSLEKESIKMAKTFMSATKSEGGRIASLTIFSLLGSGIPLSSLRAGPSFFLPPLSW
jgi:hypothetical protein